MQAAPTETQEGRGEEMWHKWDEWSCNTQGTQATARSLKAKNLFPVCRNTGKAIT